MKSLRRMDRAVNEPEGELKKKYRVGFIPGDGIGVDVSVEAEKVLRAVADVTGFSVEITSFLWGERYYDKEGIIVPSDFLETLRGFEALFLGALGAPDRGLPDDVTLAPLIQLRQGFDLFACVRPVKLLPGISCPLKNREPGDIDLVIVRENSEGEYVSRGEIIDESLPTETALQVNVHTKAGIRRIISYAFDLAKKRRNHVTLATKSNALKFSMLLWDRTFAEVAALHPDVVSDKCHVDALAMNFVLHPDRYDVVVGSNLFGDILSDIGGALCGSLGLSPSANIDPTGHFPSMFEPVHGSAPDIRGKNIANPLAAIRSVAMMLDHLGEGAAAQIVEDAVLRSLEGSVRTPDIGGNATTAAVGDFVVDAIRQSKVVLQPKQ